MSNDKLMDICQEAIEQIVKRLREEGKSDDEILDKVKKIDYTKMIRDASQVSSEITVEYFKSHMYEIAYEERLKTDEFLAHQNLIWGRCFATSQAMYVMAVEAAEIYCEFVTNDLTDEEIIPKQFKFLALQHMQARACQEFLEILYLMRFGFADGAYARWRSMYELCCCAQFISTQDEQIAKQYVEQSQTENQKYTWTKGAKDKDGNELKISTFNKIQELANENDVLNDAWKKQYKLACFVTHASPQGTFKRLANGPKTNAIPVGHSDYGITTAAEHSAIALQWITSILLSVYRNLEAISIIKAMSEWVEVIRDYYFTTAKEEFSEKTDIEEKKDGT